MYQEWGRGSYVTDTTKNLTPVEVSTTAVPLATGAPQMDVRRMTIYNAGPNTVYIGGVGVTSTTGFPVALGGSFDLVAHPSRTWAICATAESAVIRGVGA